MTVTLVRVMGQLVCCVPQEQFGLVRATSDFVCYSHWESKGPSLQVYRVYSGLFSSVGISTSVNCLSLTLSKIKKKLVYSSRVNRFDNYSSSRPSRRLRHFLTNTGNITACENGQRKNCSRKTAVGIRIIYMCFSSLSLTFDIFYSIKESTNAIIGTWWIGND